MADASYSVFLPFTSFAKARPFGIDGDLGGTEPCPRWHPRTPGSAPDRSHDGLQSYQGGGAQRRRLDRRALQTGLLSPLSAAHRGDGRAARCGSPRRPRPRPAGGPADRVSRNRSWVAQVGWSTSTTRQPSVRDAGRAWAAICGPTASSQRPNTPARLRAPVPRNERTTSSTLSRSDRRLRWRPDHHLPSSGHSPALDAQRSRSDARARSGRGTGRRQEHLPRREVAQERRAAGRVELGEHVVEQQHGRDCRPDR